MRNNMCISVESVENSKLLALFNSLEEWDKDIVITMTESLVAKNKNDISETAGSFITEKIKEI